MGKKEKCIRKKSFFMIINYCRLANEQEIIFSGIFFNLNGIAEINFRLMHRLWPRFFDTNCKTESAF
jgi:hypothetical protein